MQDITLSSVVVDWGRPDRVFIQDQGHKDHVVPGCVRQLEVLTLEILTNGSGS